MTRVSNVARIISIIITVFVICEGTPVWGRQLSPLTPGFRRAAPGRALRGHRARRVVHPDKFLEKYGYLPKLSAHGQDRIGARLQAITRFQKLFGLSVTGRMNGVTYRKMVAPRCGNPDVVSPSNATSGDDSKQPLEFFLPGIKWEKRLLKWRLLNSSPDMGLIHQRLAFKKAFHLWSQVAPLDFAEVRQQKADIEILFGGREHGDGPENAFDGKGGAVAHAFYPADGRSHFDEAETWSETGADSTTSLHQVAAHLFGHVLGLGHSNVSGSVMDPYFQTDDGNLKLHLHEDDVQAIQKLYGRRDGNDPADLSLIDTTTTSSPVTSPPLPGPDPCTLRFDAILQAHDARLYAFRGSWVWRLNDWGLEPDFPRDVTQVYDRAPANIGAAVYSWRTRHTYFFKGRIVFKYYGFHLVEELRMRQSYYPSAPQAAFMSHDSRIYILQGEHYWHFDEDRQEVTGRADSVIYKWPGLPTNIEAATRLRDGYLYLIKGSSYRKYDEYGRGVLPGYPRPLAGFFGPICGGKFVPK